MVICSSCRAEQFNGTLFCSECGADLAVPAVPTFNLAEDEVPQLPPAPWQNPEPGNGAGNYNSAPVAPRTAYNPNYNPAPPPNSNSPFGFPPDESYEPIVPPLAAPQPYMPPRQPGYSPSPPPPVAPNYSNPPAPGGYNPNPGGFMMPPKPPKPPVSSARSAIRDDLRMIVLNSGRVLECPDRDNVIIGRFDPVTGERPDIDLTSDDAVELGVSRRHVCITFRDNIPYLTDLGSKNYSFLNRRQMMRGQPYPLQNGDEVRLGNVILKVLYDPDGLL